MISKKERLSHIMELLHKNGAVNGKELSELFQVSAVTIRKDLDELASNTEDVERTFGGAVLDTRNFEARSLDLNEQRLTVPSLNPSKESFSLAQKALEFIEHGDTIFLGSGSTCCTLAAILPDDLSLSVVTNNLSAVSSLIRKHCQVFLIGGEVATLDNRTYFSSITDPAQYLESVCVNKVFTSCYGIDIAAGITVNSIISSHIFKALKESHNSWNMMISHEKFQRVGMYKICPINAIERIICTTPPQVFKDYCQQNHIALANAEISANTSPSTPYKNPK